MVEIRNLSVGYGGEAVARDISLRFAPGEVLVLVGPNGCGKSTLLRTVLGLQPALGGEILLDGRPLDQMTPREVAQKAAFLPQSRNVPDITAGRMVLHGRFPYLSYPRHYRPEDRAAARAFTSGTAAAMTKWAPSTSSAREGRRSSVTSVRASSSGQNSGATTVSFGPKGISFSTFRRATCPPPITSPGTPARSIKKGK